MSAKEFLNKIRYIDMMIKCKQEQIQILRSNLKNVSSSMTDVERVQSSKNPDKFTNPISKIIELEAEFKEDIGKLIELKRKARVMIEKLDNETEKIVLYKRYFENKHFEDIAIEMGYSWRRIHQIHSNSLKKIERFQ